MHMRTRNRTPTHYDKSLKAKSELIIELAKDVIRLNGGKDIRFVIRGDTDSEVETDESNSIQKESDT